MWLLCCASRVHLLWPIAEVAVRMTTERRQRWRNGSDGFPTKTIVRAYITCGIRAGARARLRQRPMATDRRTVCLIIRFYLFRFRWFLVFFFSGLFPFVFAFFIITLGTSERRNKMENRDGTTPPGQTRPRLTADRDALLPPVGRSPVTTPTDILRKSE